MEKVIVSGGQRIHRGSGYPGHGGRIWRQEDNLSTYYDYQTDQQCKVPICDIETLKEEILKKRSNLV